MFGIKTAVKKFRWDALQWLAPRRRVSSRGLNFTLPCNNSITEYRWSTFNSKEPEMLDWIDNTVKDGQVFVDIGANIGIYSIYAALRHPNLTVIALEPEYSNLHLLRDNVMANGLQNRVFIYGIGISDEIGLSHLQVQDLTPGAALHSESRVALAKTETGKTVVCREGIYTLTLDSFCRSSGYQPNFIKVDVDGGESRVLAGGEQTLAHSTLTSVIVELSMESAATCREKLSSAGLARRSQWENNNEISEIWERD